MIFPLICNAQNDIDSLKKYSYLLSLCKVVDNGCFLGAMSTGFFIKDGNNVYIVGAYHTFTQTNTTSDKPKVFIEDKIVISLLSHSHTKYYQYVIDLHKLKEFRENISIYTTPDIYIYKTNINPDSVDIYSIEDILKDDRDKARAKMQVISFGFKNYPTDTTNTDTYPPIKYEGQIANYLSYSKYKQVANIDSLHIVTSPKTIDGTSGSPVFFKYTINKKRNKKQWIEFGGEMVATDSVTNVAVILKKEFILHAFENYKKSLEQ